MLYLLDTNVISELRKGARCDPAVSAWEQAELIPIPPRSPMARRCTLTTTETSNPPAHLDRS